MDKLFIKMCEFFKLKQFLVHIYVLVQTKSLLQKVDGYHQIASGIMVLCGIALTQLGCVGITSVALSALVTQADSAVQLIKRHTPIRPC